MRSMMTSCSSSWRPMSMTSSGVDFRGRKKRCLSDCEEDVICMEKGDHEQDCGCDSNKVIQVKYIGDKDWAT